MTNCVKNEVYDPETDQWRPLMDTPTQFGHIHRSPVVVDDVIHRSPVVVDDVAYLLGN